ncbi:hypothetical protein [Tardiphaga sp.]|uniref:hypothetical protein n=1 Tax=Tardiphaga sp. TaxID=1926292 RepID=UPI002612BD41|nr:hypothetical protein [Tardiphaga sp.]MDB5617960.1 peroxidase [Tardiphaga sp.]
MLVDPLKDLPDHKGEEDARRSLPSLNLLRGLALGLPSGQAVARRLNITPLTDEELWTDEGNLEDANLDARRALFEAHKQDLHNNAPLWYYILREAELADQRETNVDGEKRMLGGHHPGEVGGRIVAEVLMAADNQSYLVQYPAWTPTLRITPDASAPTDDTPEIGAALTLSDIVRFVDQAA